MKICTINLWTLDYHLLKDLVSFFIINFTEILVFKITVKISTIFEKVDAKIKYQRR